MCDPSHKTSSITVICTLRAVQALLTCVFPNHYRVTYVRAAALVRTTSQTLLNQDTITAFSDATHQATRCQLTSFAEATASLVCRTSTQAEAFVR